MPLATMFCAAVDLIWLKTIGFITYDRARQKT
jgi:hypothetical protein